MEYCRKLEFTEDPDYKYLLKLFDGCIARHGFDPKVLDFTWKQNRLKRDKDLLRDQIEALIGKKKGEEKDKDKDKTTGK